VKIQAVAEIVGLNRNLVGKRIKAIAEQMKKAGTPDRVDQPSTTPKRPRATERILPDSSSTN